jgi:hypothetical protein
MQTKTTKHMHPYVRKKAMYLFPIRNRPIYTLKHIIECVVISYHMGQNRTVQKSKLVSGYGYAHRQRR